MGLPEIALDAQEMLDWLDKDGFKHVFCLGGTWYSRPGYGMPHRRQGSLRNAITHAAPTNPTTRKSAHDPKCWCEGCDMEHNPMHIRMNICPECGDKRCPHAKDHRQACGHAA